MTHPRDMLVVMGEPRPADPWKLLMEACSHSAGIFTPSQAAGFGCDLRRLSRLVDQGVLVRECRGAYRLAAYGLGLDQRVRIATLAGGSISHETAARLWGFYGFDESTTHVTLPRGYRLSSPQWVTVHETRRSLDGLTVKRRGVTVTKPLRTAIDLVGQPVSGEQYQRFLSHCVAQRLLTPVSLERFVTESGSYVRGIARLREALLELCLVDSVAEAELVELLLTAGVERPVTQFKLRDNGHFVARLDLAWPAQHVALEIDGYKHHADNPTFISDRERGNRIVGMGWALLRTTPTAVRRRPHQVIADVKKALLRSNVA